MNFKTAVRPRINTDKHGYLSANFADFRELLPMNLISRKFAQFADPFVFHPCSSVVCICLAGNFGFQI